MKFDIQQQIWNLMTVAWQNMNIFKIQDGGRNIENCFLAITQQPIVRFREIFRGEAE